jgi:hypothetical protein
VADLIAICPRCDRDVAVRSNRRLDAVLARHRTPLGLRCKGSGTVVGLEATYVIRRIHAP